MRLRHLIFKCVAVLLATLVSFSVGAALLEAWTRLTWNEKRGKPGFYLTDAARGQRLAPNYRGWFAGVPMQINSLGFRDTREYSLEKGPRTLRIVVLGDSVTFGHGSVYEHTYPFLTEQLLKEWRPDIDWQVWNLAEPGYNTAQELAQLYEVGPLFRPDVVVVAFYGNDVYGNKPIAPPGPIRRGTAWIASVLQRHLYSFDVYRRIALQIAWRAVRTTAFKQRLDHVASEEAMLSNVETAVTRPEQQFGAMDRLTDDERAALKCPSGVTQESMERELRSAPDFDRWLESVSAFQTLRKNGEYRIAFFINPIVRKCKDGDFFDAVGPTYEDSFFKRILSEGGTPTGSAYDELMHYRPSQLPFAEGHTLGNSNLAKARALFAFLRDSVLPQVPLTRETQHHHSGL